MLPDLYADYHGRLTSGLWLAKLMLLINAVLLAIWPAVKRRWFSVGAWEPVVNGGRALSGSE
jgi:hypothetical protein